MSQSNDPSELMANPGYQLWLAANAWQRAVRRVLLPFDLTNVQFAVLSTVNRLGQSEDAVAQAAVCRQSMIDPNMMSEVVRGLVGRGLMLKEPHPTDRRAHRLLLTEAGEVLLEQAREKLAPAKQEFFAPLGEEGTVLASLLNRIVQAEADR